MSGIWVVLEEREGRISRMSWEALAAGRMLGAMTGLTVNAAVVGAETAALAAEAAGKAIAKLARAHDALLVVDGSQLVAHSNFKLDADVDAFAFSGHKVYVPGSPGVLKDPTEA